MINRCALLWLTGFFLAIFLLVSLLAMYFDAVKARDFRPALFPVWHSVPGISYEMSLITYNNDYVLAMFIFFISGIALVIFRLFRRNTFTTISHTLMHVTVLYTLVYRIFMPFDIAETNFLSDFPIPYYFLIVCYTIQCMLAPLLVFFRKSRSHKVRKACRKLHAFLGLLTYAVLVWNFTLHTSKLCYNYSHVKKRHILTQPWIFLILGKIFLLIVLFVLFMPIYEGVRNRRAVAENIELPHTVHRGTSAQVVTKPYPN